MKIKKIVLTGGPCAGKTKILSKIKESLCKKGYKVFVVSESATELMNGGITPHEDGVGTLLFQRLILSYQYKKEEIYNKAADMSKEENIVIIYDRGLMDNKAYINDIEFNFLLQDLSLERGKETDEFDILSRYDMVIHLVSSAGKQGYNLESNCTRYETEEEAGLLDKRTMDAWKFHNNLKIVNSTYDFNDKINNVLNIVDKFLMEEKQNKTNCLRKKQ